MYIEVALTLGLFSHMSLSGCFCSAVRAAAARAGISSGQVFENSVLERAVCWFLSESRRAEHETPAGRHSLQR